MKIAFLFASLYQIHVWQWFGIVSFKKECILFFHGEGIASLLALSFTNYCWLEQVKTGACGRCPLLISYTIWWPRLWPVRVSEWVYVWFYEWVRPISNRNMVAFITSVHRSYYTLCPYLLVSEFMCWPTKCLKRPYFQQRARYHALHHYIK